MKSFLNIATAIVSLGMTVGTVNMAKAAPVPGPAPSAVKYSSVADQDCVMMRSSETDPNAQIDYFEMQCPGVDGYQVMLEGGDARSWIGLIKPGQSYAQGVSFMAQFQSGAGGYFPNVMGERVEWAYVNGKLAALTVRSTAVNPDDETKTLDRLVVIRLNEADLAKSCWIGSVDLPSPQDRVATAMAGQVARSLAADLSKPCLK